MTLLKRSAMWLLPLVVCGLCVSAIIGVRTRTSRNTVPSPESTDLSAKNIRLSSQARSDSYFLGTVGRLTPLVGDWNGDGRDEIGVYHAYGGSGRFVVDYNGNGLLDQADRSTLYGPSNVTPVVGDWNGDGRHQIGIFAGKGISGARGEAAEFILDSDGDGSWSSADRICGFGVVSDTPISSDWNNDGVDDIGVYHNGKWYRDINGSGGWDDPDGAAIVSYGWSGAKPVVGDWNNDGVDNFGVYQNGKWYRDVDGSEEWDAPDEAAIAGYGRSSEEPIAGDWNGDGRDDVGLFRVQGNIAQFILDSNGNGSWEAEDRVISYGAANDTPLVARQQPTR